MEYDSIKKEEKNTFIKIYKLNRESIKNIIILLIIPIILSILTNIIFSEEIFFSELEVNMELIKKISFETILDDLKILTLSIFSTVNKLEYFIILGLELIILCLTGKIKTTVTLFTIVSIIITSINKFVFQLRGTPLTLLDFFSIKTALNVVDKYDIKITISYVFSIIISVILIFLISFMKKNEKAKKWKTRVVFGFVGVITIMVVSQNRYFKNIQIWELSRSYKENGQYITLLKSLENCFIEKPRNYNLKIAEKLLSEYGEKTYTNLPNILVIMNESFSDLRTTYNLDTEENMPYFNSLKENSIKGNTYVSVLGGSTSTTEWEFLTGNSSAFIPYGSIPYLQYINNKKESLVNILNEFEYTTISLHPYNKTGYNRSEVYKYFDFCKMYFLEDMKEVEKNSIYFFDDELTYKNFFELSNDISNHKFGFIVTMQNHSPYTHEKNGKHYIEYEKINDYMNLIKKTDDSLKELIEYVENSSEKTIILFFGDHQPEFVSKNIEMFEEKEWMQNYKVPFLIWANYDIEEKENVETSVNYLSVLLSEVANTPMSPYMNFLSELKKEVPIITANGYKDKDGNIYQINDTTSPYFELINQYNILQYYQMFDKKID